MKSNPEINKDVMSHVNHETHSRVLLARMRKFFGTMTKADVGEYFDKYLRTKIEDYYKSGDNPERGDKRNPGYALWKRNTSRYRYDLTMMAKDGRPKSHRRVNNDRGTPSAPSDAFVFELPIDESWELKFANLFTRFRGHELAIMERIDAARIRASKSGDYRGIKIA